MGWSLAELRTLTLFEKSTLVAKINKERRKAKHEALKQKAKGKR